VIWALANDGDRSAAVEVEVEVEVVIVRVSVRVTVLLVVVLRGKSDRDTESRPKDMVKDQKRARRGEREKAGMEGGFYCHFRSERRLRT
jgi:hypothetical protein